MHPRLFAGSLALSLIASLPLVAQDDGKALAQKVREILKESCHSCHHGEASAGGDFDMLRHGDLLKEWASGAPLVVPKKLDGSYLWQRAGAEKSMPPRNSKVKRPGEAEIAVLKQWIEAGAPPFPDATANRTPSFLKLSVVLAAVADHLKKAGRDRGPHLRYFTLHHLYNNPGVTDADLRLHRAALAKALNSLSWKVRIVRPEAVDAQQTIFAVDVRDLDWDRGNLWQELMKAYPYGLKYRNHPDPALQRLNDDIEELTGCDMPLVRSDWFVATATRPPLYHTLLRLPTDAKELEKQLDVDVAANFKEPTPERIARGAMHKSGVSGQNRLVERHSAKHGAYWKSYDFLPGRARSKLTRFPLGPLNLFDAGKHPFPSQAFEHDGGELIFNLPNGLQGYLLINGKDQRIDEGPIAVVGDEQKTAGTAAIVTGVSCMSCHKHGMIGFKDVVRDSNSVFGQAERMVKLLYPEKSKMDELVQEDEDRFMAALDKTIGPFLRVGDDKQKPIREFPEPVGEVARLHRLGYLDLKTVTLELDLEDPEVIRTTVGETKLKRLGLDSLLRGGVIGRLDWEAIDGVSLMQELARELRCTPFAVPRD